MTSLIFREKEQIQEFGVGYENALEQLSGLQELEDSKKLEKEVELLPGIAELVPESITLNGFRDLIAKMTPNIILHRDKNSYTALSMAAYRANKDCIEALLNDARPGYREITTKYGNTALHIAANSGYLYGAADCVETLLKDARPGYREIPNKTGESALYNAAAGGYLDCVEALLKESRPKYREMVDKNGRTPLHIAANHGHVTCVEALLNDSRPEYADMLDKNEKKPIHLSSNIEVVRLLLEAKYQALVSAYV
eukprot:TRINITY_DN3143_c1_g1_i1.p1 TRINITY_DN3143_c1_g1~~TRINITY_DN3143_c1_g1_i1.p1  ORF type:complete len:254 (+),score=52.15 TRINITY_DN3143_c1_g1_i1:193-954(+)